MRTGGVLIAPYAPSRSAKGGPPFTVATLLRMHFLQQGFNLPEQAMQEAPYDTPKSALVQQLEQTKARIRVWTERPFRPISAAARVRQGQVPGTGQEPPPAG